MKTNPGDAEFFPFKPEHLQKFREEIQEAGSFKDLMVIKKALKLRDGIVQVQLYHDADSYKKKFLTGVYASLEPFYATDMPYVFWSALYEAVLKFYNETQ